MRLIDDAVVMRIYGRGGEFPIPLMAVKGWLKETEASRLLSSEWHQVVFLCLDKVVVAYAGVVNGKPRVLFTSLPPTPEGLAVVPGLYELWLWRCLGKTWDEVHRVLRGIPELTKSMS